MSTVYLCSPTNSTMFTTCCDTAICDDQDYCPRCNEEVSPKGHRARWDAAYGPTRRKLAARNKSPSQPTTAGQPITAGETE